MDKDIARYTMRVNRTLLQKFQYIAQYDGRSINKQIEQLMKKTVAEFEQEHGVITDELLREMYSNRYN